MAKGRCWPRVAAALRRGSLFSLPASGGRLGDVDRIGGGEATREPLSERPLEPAFADLLPVALGLVVEFLLHDGSLRNCHGCSPCKRRTGRAIVQITRGVWRAFPCRRSATGKISLQSSPSDD